MKPNRPLQIAIVLMVLIQVFQMWLLWHRGFFKNADPATVAMYIVLLSITSLAVVGAVYYKGKRSRRRPPEPIRPPQGLDDNY